MKTLIKNASIVNEDLITVSDILIEDDKIISISKTITEKADTVLDASGLHLFLELLTTKCISVSQD